MLPPALQRLPTPAGVQRFRFVGDEMQNRVMALPRRLDDRHLQTVGDALAAVIGMHEDAGQPRGEILALMIVAGPQAGHAHRAIAVDHHQRQVVVARPAALGETQLGALQRATAL